MRKILAITLLTFALLTANAQKIVVNKTTVDVGRTGFEMPVTGIFELRNKGPKSIVITSVKADCGCTQVEWPKKTISSGEKFTIKMTYDARMLGHFTKQVTVYCQQGGNKASTKPGTPILLKMKGVVQADYQDHSKRYPYDLGGLLSDLDNIEFDDVSKGDTMTVKFKVFNNTTEVATPNLMHLPSYLTAVAVPATLPPNREGTIAVTLHSDKVHDMGLSQSSVYLAKKLGETVNQDIEIPVSVVLLPDTKLFDGSNRQYAPRMSLSADVLTLDSKHRSSTIIITNSGRMPLNISSLQMFTRGLKLQLNKKVLAAGEKAKLKIKADPDLLKKARSKPRVLMITNDPTRPKVIITINWK